jgi:DNA invertase Pin-like site-specific DNA recombinase
MNKDLSIFKSFAKTSKVAIRAKSNNAVIYTRVSDKKQEHNYSLGTQKKQCLEFARRNNFNVVGFYGGTYESAKTDERKEFQQMLNFVKRSKENIGHIIVFDESRFSRTGTHGMYIAETLAKQGIILHSALTGTDATTISGRLHQQIKFVFSNHDNEVKKERVILGMVDKMREGYWPAVAPIGYDQVTVNKVQRITINEKGKLIRKAFEWKAELGLSNVEIIARLKELGLNIPEQTLSRVFKNPFYCGILSHNLLDGEVLEGKHEKLISKELFLKVNGILSANHSGYKNNLESEPHPLKKFVRCGDCESGFAGYEVKKKGIHYYKCRKKGCKCNKSAKFMHKLFEDTLACLSINPALKDLLKDELEETFLQHNAEQIEAEKALRIKLNEVNKKIETLEERFAFGEIEKELYDKFIFRLREERNEISRSLSESSFESSNLSKMVEKSLELACNLQNIWNLGNYRIREKLQYLVFPQGILFDRKNEVFRTREINSIFLQIALVSQNLGTKKEGETGASPSLSHLVIPEGFEPAL